jgi:hypothetical protein
MTLLTGGPIGNKHRGATAMTSVSWVGVSTTSVAVLARLAYTFVRAQFEVISMPARLLRKECRRSAIPEEEQW